MKPLSRRFLEHWRAKGFSRPGDRLAVACSGGLDSLVLLHLLRFQASELGIEVAAAHFDHRMRAGSAEDAQWMRGLAGAWKIGLREARAEEIPGGEESARSLRYAFLEGLVRRGEFDRVLTAHQADDQVETVLFRIVRGTGLRGLRGIPVSRDPGIVRPLLPFWRSELEGYARLHHLRPRLDPTNESLRFARNRLRIQVLPLLEAAHPGAREALLRLARNSERALEALDALLGERLERIYVDQGDDFAILDLASMRAQPDSVIGEIIRRVAGTLDTVLTESGTASAVEFIMKGASGGRLDLARELRLEAEFDRLRVCRVAGPKERSPAPVDQVNQVIEIEAVESGEGELRLSDRCYRVRWGAGLDRRVAVDSSTGWEWADFGRDELSFPVFVRGWRHGDRIRVRGGRKKLKKLLREARIPRGERDRIPVIADAEGLVVWLFGRAHGESPKGDDRWRIGVRRLGNG